MERLNPIKTGGIAYNKEEEEEEEELIKVLFWYCGYIINF
jgi:hypothetical protein